jgi:hypothetical protein
MGTVDVVSGANTEGLEVWAMKDVCVCSDCVAARAENGSSFLCECGKPNLEAQAMAKHFERKVASIPALVAEAGELASPIDGLLAALKDMVLAYDNCGKPECKDCLGAANAAEAAIKKAQGI